MKHQSKWTTIEVSTFAFTVPFGVQSRNHIECIDFMYAHERFRLKKDQDAYYLFEDYRSARSQSTPFTTSGDVTRTRLWARSSGSGQARRFQFELVRRTVTFTSTTARKQSKVYKLEGNTNEIVLANPPAF